MTKREFEKIGERLLSSLPENFIAKQNLLFIKPIGHLLRGVSFGSSADKKAFYVSVFVQPLFIPQEYICLDFGDRLNEDKWWNTDNPHMFEQLLRSIKENALTYITRMESVEDMIGVIAPRGIAKNKNILEAVAFSLARMGRIDEACKKLEELAEQMSGPNKYNMRVSWRDERAQRALYLRLLLLKDPQAAQKQLDEWEAYTLKNLKLEKYR